MRILLIEDEPVTAKLMQNILQDFGNCDYASDGESGLELFKRAHNLSLPYDLICLDIILPDISGKILLSKIRGYEKTLNIEKIGKSKIIMTSSIGRTSVIKKMHDLGCEAYIIKPINVKIFKNKIIEVMNLNLS